MALARSSRYGKSKLDMLYPMMRSGSTVCTKSRHALSKFASLSNERTCEPTIWAQEFNVKTFRMKGLLSPVLLALDGCYCQLPKAPTLTANHVCNLDNRIDLCLRKYAFPACALNIKAQDANWGKF